jgi:tRNA G10  N-methylase Trm11
MTYFFYLGRIHDLSQAELEVVLARAGVTTALKPVTDDLLLLEATGLDATMLMAQLGGTVKIASAITQIAEQTPENLEKFIFTYLKENSKKSGKLLFALHAGQELDALLPNPQELKEKLKSEGISSRYLKAGDGLGAAQLSHHAIHELQLIKVAEALYLTHTEAVQDIDGWSARDFGKPYRDPKKGMLPPKLARMMLNLAIGARKPGDMTLLDPFCGTGTVLIEAAMLDCKQLIGSDLDRDAITGSGKNMQWFATTFGKKIEYALSVQDALQLEEKGTIDIVVTEPFLGKPNPKEPSSANTLKGLEKMYLGMLKKLYQALKNGGRIALVMPAYTFGDRVKTLDAVIDRLESLGYTREKGPFRYSRPQTIVQRDIVVLQKK